MNTGYSVTLKCKGCKNVYKPKHASDTECPECGLNKFEIITFEVNKLKE